jgi:dynein regulatory complex protein 1
LKIRKQRGIVTPPSDKKKEVSKGKKQIDDSRTRLDKLEKDGFELVTNIRVAGDSREHARITEEEETTRLRKERLEQEAKSASEKFEEVNLMNSYRSF